MVKKALFICLLGLLTAGSDCFADQVDTFWKSLERCSKDSDCVSAAVAWPACNHHCGEYIHDKCDEKTRVCPAMNKTTPILVDCAANLPCQKPKRIWCEKGACKSE